MSVTHPRAYLPGVVVRNATARRHEFYILVLLNFQYNRRFSTSLDSIIFELIYNLSIENNLVTIENIILEYTLLS
jgi:hypothetical protein